jgi:RNA polymerase sigma factor (TIGR02999 family)
MVDHGRPGSDGGAKLETDALFAQVYDRLKAMAGRRLAGHARGTLDTTAVVHELYLRVGSSGELKFAHPVQFFTYAARAMRHLLTDRARARLARRAGGDWMRTTLSGGDLRLALDSAEQVLALDQAMHLLEQEDARAAQVVELVCFAGVSQDQAADLLGIARRTVVRDLCFARAFLQSELD